MRRAMGKYPIWTREYTEKRLEDFQKHVEGLKGRTAIGQWHDTAGLPQDSLYHYCKKYGLEGRYRAVKEVIRKANRRRRW